MHVSLKIQHRNDRLYKYRQTYLTGIDIADFGYHGAAVRATGYFPDEIKEIKKTCGEVVYTEVPSDYIQRFADISLANSTTEETELTQGVAE